MRIVVTGGAGFLGSHFCDRLLAEGHRVVALDNLVTGNAANLAHLRGHDRFQFVRCDISAGPLPVEGPIEALADFASPASPIDYAKLPIETLQVGSFGVFHCLDLVRRHQARFLLTSTSECYGDPEEHPQREEYWGHVNPIGPRSCYDESKRFAEALTMAFHRQHGLDTRMARIFNTYGPRMRLNDGRVVPQLIAQALRGEALTVFGDGGQTRSFCYVDDLIEGLYRLLLASAPDPLPVNLGNPTEITILEFATRIRALTGNRSAIVFRPLPQDDPKRRCPVIDRARSRLNWQPQVSLEEGLRKSWEYFQAAVGSAGKTVTA